MRIVFLGLCITSSWGNGHASTYRGLLRALDAQGHDVVFLERDVPWYRENRDLPHPPYGQTHLYRSVAELQQRFGATVRSADAVVLGSFVPEAVPVARWVFHVARGAVLFYDIDTPVTLAALARGDCSYLTPGLVPRFDAYLSFTGGPILERLERGLGARRAVPLYCAVDPDDYPPAAERPESHLLGYLGTYSADRQAGLERMLLAPARRLPDARFVVAGPQYPPELVWPRNVARREHVPSREHPAFYHDQRFTLNVTRADMTAAGYAPSVRLFEAACTETPVVSDAWAGLETFFRPGREILVARSSDEVVRLVTEVSAAERERIGRRARERVLAAHTPKHRARTLVEVVDSLLERRLARV